MAKYRVTLDVDPEHLQRLKDKGLYPFPKNGYEFYIETVIESESLEPFSESLVSKALDPRLKAEVISENTEETD